MSNSDRVVGANSLNMCIEKTSVFDSGRYRQVVTGNGAETAQRTIRLKVKGELTSN